MLRKSGLKVIQQNPIKVVFDGVVVVVFDGVVVGEFTADLLVEDRILVELKAVSMLKDEHMAQALNYLRATGAEICLLINFGTTKVEIKRLRPSSKWKTSNP